MNTTNRRASAPYLLVEEGTALSADGLVHLLDDVTCKRDGALVTLCQQYIIQPKPIRWTENISDSLCDACLIMRKIVESIPTEGKMEKQFNSINVPWSQPYDIEIEEVIRTSSEIMTLFSEQLKDVKKGRAKAFPGLSRRDAKSLQGRVRDACYLAGWYDDYAPEDRANYLAYRTSIVQKGDSYILQVCRLAHPIERR